MLVIKTSVQSLIDSSLALLKESNALGETEKTELIIQVDSVLEMHLIYAYFLETYGNEIEMLENESLFQEFIFENDRKSYEYVFKIYKKLCVSIACDDGAVDDCFLSDLMENCFILNLKDFSTFTGGIYGV